MLHLVKESTENQIRNEEEEPYCYSKPGEPVPQHSHFTTKTKYGLVKGTLQEPETGIHRYDDVATDKFSENLKRFFI